MRAHRAKHTYTYDRTLLSFDLTLARCKHRRVARARLRASLGSSIELSKHTHASQTHKHSRTLMHTLFHTRLHWRAQVIERSRSHAVRTWLAHVLCHAYTHMHIHTHVLLEKNGGWIRTSKKRGM